MPLLGTVGAGSVKSFGGLANLGYFIKNSLRFRSSAAAYLSKTYGTSPTSRTTITHSFWLKIGALSNAYNIFALFGTFDNYEQISLVSPNNTNGWIGNSLRIAGPGGSEHIRTTQVFRDPAAWYHIVVVYDTTNATATDRVRLYVNGSRVTSFAASANPTQNQQTTQWLVSGAESDIGKTGNSSTQTFDGYMAEINVIDGQALDPSSFGKTDALTGQWIPKKFGGSYGTNGFYLKFADASAATAAAIGKDSSPNGNNWTPNNISVTSGATYDAMIDSPTLSEVASNFCTLNPLATSNFTYSNGNLKGVSRSTGDASTIATIGVTSGKWYFEGTIADNSYKGGIGILGTTTGSFASSVFDATLGNAALGYALQAYDGQKRNNSTSSAYYGSALPDSANVGIAFDLDNNKIFARVNGTWLVSSDPVTGSNPMFNLTSGATYFPAISDDWGSQSVYWDINFGQRPFSYTAPSGFKALNTYNLP